MKIYKSKKIILPLSDKHMIMVYGSLLVGEPNHYLLSNAEFVKSALTKPEYELIDINGQFPAMVSGGRTAVKGEVYYIDVITLAAIDRLEGHPNFYKRTKISLTDESIVETYILDSYLNRSYSNRGYLKIPMGDWRAWKKNMKKAIIENRL